VRPTTKLLPHACGKTDEEDDACKRHERLVSQSGAQGSRLRHGVGPSGCRAPTLGASARHAAGTRRPRLQVRVWVRRATKLLIHACGKAGGPGLATSDLPWAGCRAPAWDASAGLPPAMRSFGPKGHGCSYAAGRGPQQTCWKAAEERAACKHHGARGPPKRRPRVNVQTMRRAKASRPLRARLPAKYAIE
jgi:hypothetical protein